MEVEYYVIVIWDKENGTKISPLVYGPFFVKERALKMITDLEQDEETPKEIYKHLALLESRKGSQLTIANRNN